MKTVRNIKPHTIREVFLYLFTTIVLMSFGQNTTTEVFSAKDILEVVVDGHQIFNIDIKAEVRNDIEVASVTSGEYQDYFQINSKVDGNQLFINLEANPLKQINDDKRNAHKVISANLVLALPEKLSLSIVSDVGSVNAQGKFKALKFNLAQGDCYIKGIVREAIIKTTSGNINAETNGAIIETDSQSGLVDFPSDMFGFNIWKLTTLSGNITVNKL